MQSFPSLDFRVSWLTNQNKTWKNITFRKSGKAIKSGRINYTLADLPYAHRLYDIRVFIKTLAAKEERMWSQFAPTFAYTLSKLPDGPPGTTVGSYEYYELSGDIYIYWQKLQPHQENGNDFCYVVEVDGHPNLKPSKNDSNYALFSNLPDRNYTFRIWSQNDIGRSDRSSEVFVPAQKFGKSMFCLQLNRIIPSTTFCCGDIEKYR